MAKRTIKASMVKKGTPSASLSAVYAPQIEKKDDSSYSFGAVLRKYRNDNGMSQPELAEIMGVSRNTITNWENDRARPEIDAIRTLCAMFGIPLYELFGIPTGTQLTAHEKVIFRQYRKLSPVGQRIVDRMVESVMAEEQNARDRYLDDNYFLSELQSTTAAAGPGCAFIDSPPEYMFLKKNGYNETADTLIRVSGASMEPQYHNGDLMYVKYTQTAEDGDIVICSTADGAVIKQMLGHKLYSLNKALLYGDKSEDDHVTIVGKVLGKVSELELPDDDDLPALEEVKSADVRAFKEKYGLL